MKILKYKNNKKINLVSTPIGNIKDITYRAVEVLKESDIILAEDTTVSSKLLKYYDINAKLVSFHKYNEMQMSDKVIDWINSGKIVSMISDAGTPLINDPGTFIAKKLIEEDIMLYPIVGASSISASMSINSFNSKYLTYYGFIDKKSKDKIKKIKEETENDVLLLISPNYISGFIKTLDENHVREIIIAKEITKIHEQHIYTTTTEFLENIDDLVLKGEYTMIVKHKTIEYSQENVDEEIKMLLEQNVDKKEVVKLIKTKYKLQKNEVYQKVLKITESI